MSPHSGPLLSAALMAGRCPVRRPGTQHLVSPHAVSAHEAVGSLLAVQAENPSQAAWAVASRTQNPDQADLATLLDDGAVLRTHVLRPTWHFVRAEDIGWLLDLTGPRVRPTLSWTG
jgi:hypothetical protein